MIAVRLGAGATPPGTCEGEATMYQLGHALYELWNLSILSGWPATIMRRVITVSRPPCAVSTCFFVPGARRGSTWYTSGGGGTGLGGSGGGGSGAGGSGAGGSSASAGGTP